MELFKMTGLFIKRLIEVNGLALLISLIILIGGMGIITKITGDNKWARRLFIGGRKRNR